MTLTIEPASLAARNVKRTQDNGRRTHQMAPNEVGELTRCGLPVDLAEWELVDPSDADCTTCELATMAAAIANTASGALHDSAKLAGTSRVAALRAGGMSLMLAAHALDGADHG